MTFDAIYAAAIDTLNRLAAGGEMITPDKTICVISTRTGRVYFGVSHPELINGVMTEIHAEIDAVRNMQAYGESAIGELILISAMNGTAMLPCSNCISFILSQGPENAMACVAMPDRMIPLSEIGRSQYSQSVPLKSLSAKGDLLKDRISSIMDGVEDDDEEDEELIEELQAEGKKKKRFFGLF